MPSETPDPRRVFAQARVAAAQRIVETGKAFCTDMSDENWFDFLDAVADIQRLESSPLARRALGPEHRPAPPGRL